MSTKAKLVAVLKTLAKSKTTWKLVGTLVVATGVATAADLVSLSEALKVVTDGLGMVS